MIDIPIKLQEQYDITRTEQLFSISIPFAQGATKTHTAYVIVDDKNNIIPCQLSPLSYWSDKSIKWAELKFVANLDKKQSKTVHLRSSIESSPQYGINIFESDSCIEINTGATNFIVNKDELKPLFLVETGLSDFSSSSSKIRLKDHLGDKYKPKIKHISRLGTNYTNATLQTTILVQGEFVPEDPEFESELSVNFEARLSFFVNSAKVKFEFTLHNPKAAKHPGGLWDLGDENSFLFEQLSFLIPVKNIGKVEWQNNGSEQIAEHENKGNLRIEQFGSGGRNWKSPVHKNAEGDVKLKFNGFKVISEEQVERGKRISPVVCIHGEKDKASFYLEKFWQNFPKAISSSSLGLSVSLFPLVVDQPYELQAGEKKTHTLWMSFALKDDKTEFFTDVEKPVSLILEPQYIATTHVLPYFDGALVKDPIDSIIAQGLSGESNFFKKREVVDEYGWRNFGDIYADHETLEYTGSDIFVSHYNNQYDPLYGFIRQYLNTGKQEWFELADDLAKHIKDIDIYNTEEDRDEYNGGLFWHTDHYLDASTCTHRTHSKNHKAVYDGFSMGGGPGGQHCYTTGLMYHYLLTGSDSSKQAVITLAKWIKNFYEGSSTLFAQMFAIKNHQQAGMKDQLLDLYPLDRGIGNYIVAQLDAFNLTQDRAYLDCVEHIIENTVHPLDDIAKRKLDNVEESWFYTVFFQSLARYLAVKEELNELDDTFYYARDSLLHYADWMLENEYPYLEKPDILEYPNHTWAAQDIRKANLFYIAYYYSADKNKAYKEKGDEFHDYVSEALKAEPSRSVARILAILMQNNGPFSYFMRSTVHEHHFDERKEYAEKATIAGSAKAKRALKLIGEQVGSLSVKKELAWLSRRSDKIANLLGHKY